MALRCHGGRALLRRNRRRSRRHPASMRLSHSKDAPLLPHCIQRAPGSRRPPRNASCEIRPSMRFQIVSDVYFATARYLPISSCMVDLFQVEFVSWARIQNSMPLVGLGWPLCWRIGKPPRHLGRLETIIPATSSKRMPASSDLTIGQHPRRTRHSEKTPCFTTIIFSVLEAKFESRFLIR